MGERANNLPNKLLHETTINNIKRAPSWGCSSKNKNAREEINFAKIIFYYSVIKYELKITAAVELLQFC